MRTLGVSIENWVFVNLDKCFSTWVPRHTSVPRDCAKCSSRIKGCPQANYTWSQISRMRRSLEQIKQFEVNFQTKSINSYNSKKITKCQTQFKRDGYL